MKKAIRRRKAASQMRKARSESEKRAIMAYMDEVSGGQVHVKNVFIGDLAFADEPPDIVHDGRVVDQRPPERT